MGWFKSAAERELDVYIARINMNMSNNYKDAAQENLKELEKKFEELVAAGKLKEKAKQEYESIIGSYRIKLTGYTHKDQKPYWT